MLRRASARPGGLSIRSGSSQPVKCGKPNVSSLSRRWNGRIGHDRPNAKCKRFCYRYTKCQVDNSGVSDLTGVARDGFGKRGSDASPRPGATCRRQELFPPGGGTVPSRWLNGHRRVLHGGRPGRGVRSRAVHGGSVPFKDCPRKKGTSSLLPRDTPGVGEEPRFGSPDAGQQGSPFFLGGSEVHPSGWIVHTTRWNKPGNLWRRRIGRACRSSGGGSQW